MPVTMAMGSIPSYIPYIMLMLTHALDTLFHRGAFTLGVPHQWCVEGFNHDYNIHTNCTKANATLASCVTLLYSLSHGMINQYAGRTGRQCGCNWSCILVLALDKAVYINNFSQTNWLSMYRSHTIKEGRASLSDRTQKTGYREQH